MAFIHYLLFTVLVITPFVENAPSTKKNSAEDELHTRLVFVDNDDNAINSNSHLITGSTASLLSNSEDGTEIISVTRSKNVLEPSPANTKYMVQENSTPTKMDDERQNWGIIVEEKDLPDDESYYNRPLSIPRNINTKILAPEKPPSKDQARILKPEVSNAVAKPSACDMAIITCCGVNSSSNECFKSQRCYSITVDMLPNVCSKTSVNNTIETISKYYRGVLGK